MTDRELLEAAANAAGYAVEFEEGGDVNGYWPYSRDLDGECLWWNPLTDDGDALRLAVKLGLVIECHSCVAMDYNRDGSQYGDWWGGLPDSDEDHVGAHHEDVDALSHIRRAIVRAAAFIGAVTGDKP